MAITRNLRVPQRLEHGPTLWCSFVLASVNFPSLLLLWCVQCLCDYRMKESKILLSGTENHCYLMITKLWAIYPRIRVDNYDMQRRPRSLVGCVSCRKGQEGASSTSCEVLTEAKSTVGIFALKKCKRPYIVHAFRDTEDGARMAWFAFHAS